ncbi:MAG TPA: dihydroorotate dehydrogenase-like protein [Polyangiaceae bacterium]|nr:dihydroorotate dehydrogenase-like protein [Polyangiaceae bacterium]
MDLTTKYLGLTLKHPFVMGASPLVDDLDQVSRLAENGASAIVMHSLFEEQLVFEQVAAHAFTAPHAESSAEATSYLPPPAEFALGPDEYLEQIGRIKRRVDLPVIGSLNGVSARGWLHYAGLIQQAGADALELNLYAINSNPERSGASIEAEQLAMIEQIKVNSSIPVALKLSPYYTSLAHFVSRASAAGADGFIVFNRFYQPDFNLEELEIEHRVRLSDPGELLLRLRWLAILSAQHQKSFAVTGGVRHISDALKALMAGADSVQLVSEILERGPQRFAELAGELTEWLEMHGYDSLSQLRGSMNLSRCPDPSAYERAHYTKILQSWRGLDARTH